MQQNGYRFSSPALARRSAPKKSRLRMSLTVLFLAMLIALLSVGGYHYVFANSNKTKALSATSTSKTKTSTNTAKTSATATTVSPATTACTANALSQNVIVSISQRHMWACTNTTVSYDSPVVTGMENLAADLTPTGTYHIYAKETDLTLRGSDSTGSWNDPVSYWMPFLDNQYGAYGFHDATWRSPSDFGNISPYSSNASHGCVELPLATAKWLYNWVSVGTTVTIES